MNIVLTQEYEQLIQKQIAKGRFTSVDEVFAYLFEVLENSDLEYDRWLAQTQPKVESAIAQLDRGEGIDAEVVMDELRVRLDRARQNRQ